MYSILDSHLFELFALGNIRFRIRVVHKVVVNILHIYCILDIRSRRLFAVNNIRQRIYIVDNLALDMDLYTRDNLDTRYLKMLGWDQHKIQQYKTTVQFSQLKNEKQRFSGVSGYSGFPVLSGQCYCIFYK